MIELIVKEYLDAVSDIPVYVEDEPIEAPAAYLLIKRTAKTENEHIKNANIAIECYASSAYDTCELCEHVENWMQGIIDHEKVSRCKFVTSYKDNDVIKKKYRYRATFDIYSL